MNLRKKNVSRQTERPDVKTEPVKPQAPKKKVKQQKPPVCELQLEVEGILRDLAKHEKLANLTIAS